MLVPLLFLLLSPHLRPLLPHLPRFVLMPLLPLSPLRSALPSSPIKLPPPPLFQSFLPLLLSPLPLFPSSSLRLLPLLFPRSPHLPFLPPPLCPFPLLLKLAAMPLLRPRRLRMPSVVSRCLCHRLHLVLFRLRGSRGSRRFLIRAMRLRLCRNRLDVLPPMQAPVPGGR
jgi:hypothetical protein